MAFKKATKQQARLRLALIGPAGSGKTFTALTLAKYMGDAIAVIDTEHGSASKYAGRVAEFDVDELTDFAPAKYIAALKEARGYPVVVIDSLSHAWMGKGGLLDQADSKGGKFQAWKDLTPQHHALVEAILAFPGHVIVTMRSKTEYEITKDDRGKVNVERVGTAAVQRDGVEYEFDVVGQLDQSNTLHVIKSRCPEVQGDIRKPGAELAETLKAWLSDGEPEQPTDKLRRLCQALGYGDAQLLKWLIGKFGLEESLTLTAALESLTEEQIQQAVAVFADKVIPAA